MKKIMMYKEYDEKFKGNMIYCEFNKHFYMSLEDVLDGLEHESDEVIYNIKNSLYGTIKTPIKLSVESITDILEESDDAFEDYEVWGEGLDAIKNFVEEWNTKYVEYSYFADMNLKIKLDE